MATSLEKILIDNGVSRLHFIEALGFRKEVPACSMWYRKISGKLLVTPGEIKQIDSALKSLEIKDEVEYRIDKLLIV